MPDSDSGFRRDKKPFKGKKGGGPAPARHIPWPEIFKHHISVVEGHSKMLEMVQKHTVPGTGNYNTITNLVDRGYDMLRAAKEVSRVFVPPTGDREKVPLGSSSDTMYPGYSPADIKYGEASSEFGKAIGSLKAQGKDWKPPVDGPEFQVGQGRGSKKTEKKIENKEKSATEDDGTEGGRVEIKAVKSKTADVEPKEEGENPYFMIDTNPTPLAKPDEQLVETEKKKKKKEKKEKKEKKAEQTEVTKETGETEAKPVIETEDITAEVDAKLKEKHKKESKRRRESGGDEEKTVKKSKKDKSKKREGDTEENDDGQGKKKRKKSAE